MSNTIKKAASVVLALMVVFTVVPGDVFVSDVKADHSNAHTIEQLTAQLAALSAQLAALQGSSTSTCPAATFTRSLTLGSTGDDVKALQCFLNTHGAQVAVSGAGSSGNESTYFGSLTQAALAKYQAANAITPAVGYFGPITRAQIASMAAVPPTPPTGTPPTPPTGAGLTVTVSSDTPVAATIISDGTSAVAGSQALIHALHLTFTGTGKVTGLKLKRSGISSDSDIDNAYLYESDGKTRIAEMNSFLSGVVTFTNSAGLFTVAGQKTVYFLFDLNADATSGKTIGFGVNAAADVTTDAPSVSGTFPANGNLMTTAVVSDFGRLEVTEQTTSASVDPGTTGFEAFKFQLAASNQNLKLWSLRLKNLGSVDAKDLGNFKLYDGGTQVGSAVASLDTDKNITFDLGSAPLTIQSGITKNMSVKLDVLGGATRTIQLSIQRATDISVTDANYNVNLAPDADGGGVATFSVTNATSATINSGSITVNLSTNSPSGNIALNGTDIELARYDVKAVGEDIKISAVDIQITEGSSTWDKIKDVKLVYDGSQVGVTDADMEEDIDVTFTTNFILPAGVTKQFSIKASAASPSTTGDAIVNGNTAQAILDVGSSNAQRQVSLGTFNFPTADVNGNTLTISSSSLSGAKNNSLGNVTATDGTLQKTVASFLLTAGAAEGVDVSQVVLVSANNAVGTDGTGSLGDAMQNINAYQGSTKLNASTVTTSPTDAASTSYTLNFSPSLSVPVNSTVQVDIKADIPSDTAGWTDADEIELDSVTGNGKITGSTANIASGSGVLGQSLTTTTAGELTVSVDSSTPISSQNVMGATDRTLAIWKFEANTTEDLRIYQIIVTDASGNANGGNIKNLKLYVDGSQVGATAPALGAATSGTATFGTSTGNPLFTVLKGGNKLVTVKADMTAYADGPTAGGSQRMEVEVPATITGIATDEIIARGESGNFAVTPTANEGVKTANTMFQYRTGLSASIACSGTCTGRTRGATDIVGKLSLTGNSSADAQIRAAMQVNDDTDEGAAGNNWQTVNGVTANAVAADTAVSVDGASISWTATTDFEVDDLLVYDLPATTDLTTFSRVSFWLQSLVALTGSDDLAFFVNDAADTTTTSQTTLGAFTIDVWTFVDIAMPTSRAVVAADDFMGIRVLSAGELTTVAIKVDEFRFYNDSIVVDISGNLCAVTCVPEDGAGTSPTPIGTAINFKDSGGTTDGVGYFTGTATSGSARIFMGADIGAPTGAQTATTLTPTAGAQSLGGTAQVFDLVANTNQLVLADTTANESLSLSLDLGTVSASGSVTAGDFRWWDQSVTATSPITWFGGTTPISINMGY